MSVRSSAIVDRYGGRLARAFQLRLPPSPGPAHAGAAREHARFGVHHFPLIVLRSNGLAMLGHDDRLRTLTEIHRVLAPDGAFLFSTYNRDSPEHGAGFRLPRFEATLHPLR